MRVDRACVAGQLLVAQEAARGPRQQWVEPEQAAQQRQRGIGPVIAMAAMLAFMLQDQRAFGRAEAQVEIRADHHAW